MIAVAVVIALLLLLILTTEASTMSANLARIALALDRLAAIEDDREQRAAELTDAMRGQ